MAGRGNRNRDSGIGNQTLGNLGEEQDLEALEDVVDEEEEEAELEELVTPPPGPDAEELV